MEVIAMLSTHSSSTTTVYAVFLRRLEKIYSSLKKTRIEHVVNIYQFAINLL